MYDIFTYIGVLSGVNVGEYSIHGASGKLKYTCCTELLPNSSRTHRPSRCQLVAPDEFIRGLPSAAASAGPSRTITESMPLFDAFWMIERERESKHEQTTIIHACLDIHKP